MRRRNAHGLTAACLAALLISLGGPATGEPPTVRMAEPPGVTTPPRTISDITAILDAQKLEDPRDMQQNLRRADRKPPKDTGRNGLARFYLERGTAADLAGRAAQSIDDLTKANRIGGGLPLEERLEILRALFSTELGAGNSSNALRYLRDSVALSGSLWTEQVHQIRLYARYARELALEGNLEDARKYLAEAKGLMERLARYAGRKLSLIAEGFISGSTGKESLWTEFGDELLAVTAWARGEVLRIAGRYLPAEAAYRTSIEHYSRDQEEDRINVVRSDLAAALGAQGRHMEAEITVRHALLFALRTHGRNSRRTGARVRRLADIIDTQGRKVEAEKLYRASLDIFARTGTAPGSREMLAARVGLGGNLARQDRWAEALAQFHAARAGGAKNAALLDRYIHGNPDYALVLINNGRIKDGLAMARRSTDRAQKMKGKDHVVTAAARGIAAMALAALGRDRQALKEYSRSSAVLLAHLTEGRAEPQRLVTGWRIKIILQSHIRLLARVQGMPLGVESGGDAVARAFRVADALRGRKVQHSLNVSAARAAAGTPQLARLIRRREDLSGRLAALETLYADVLSQPTEQPGAETGDYPNDDTSYLSRRFYGNWGVGDDLLGAAREELIERMAARRRLKLGLRGQLGWIAGDIPKRGHDYPIAAANARRRPTVGGSGSRQMPDASNSLAEEIALLGRERARIGIEIRRRFPAYAALMAPELPTIDRAQGRLKPDQALIATYTGESETYVWAVPKRGQPAFATVPIGMAKMTALVNQLRKGLEYRDDTLAGIPVFDVGLAHELYKALLQPVAAGWKGAKDLLVVAHGPLGQLPFSLLVTAKADVKDGTRALFSGYKDVPWLIRSHSVTTLPTVGAMMVPRPVSHPNSKRRSFIGFADPWFNAAQAAKAKRQPQLAAAKIRPGDTGILLRAVPRLGNQPHPRLGDLPRLPQTAEEIRGIARWLRADPERDIFTGRRSNEQVVKSMDLTPYRVVAFATHALAPHELDGLIQPALALTAPKVADVSGDGLLTMAEILRLKLDADWVVLSGCNTGNTGKLGAEAISSLGSAFLHAGARSLLITQWEVESTVAKLLVTDLFRRQAADAGLKRAQALRRAQLALMGGPGYIDADGGPLFAYAHPLFWAPFVLFGEGAGTRATPSQKLGALPKN